MTRPTKTGRDFARRVALLRRFIEGELVALHSVKLTTEYDEQVREPRNDFVKAFLEILTDPAGASSMPNWPRWAGAQKEKAQGCRFPSEDTHVLRTAWLSDGTRSLLSSEEDRVTRTRDCIRRRFNVDIHDPTVAPTGGNT